MKIATSIEEAIDLYPGWELYKDSETEIRCYFPGEIEKPVENPAVQIIAQYTAAVQNRLDAFFQDRGYDGVLSAATYATSSVPKFKAEGQYAVSARDATWAKCYEILAAVESGALLMPSQDELLAELPPLVWPV